METKFTYVLSLLLICLISCKDKNEKTSDTKPTELRESKIDDYQIHNVQPAPFPTLDMAGFQFPQDSVTLNRWIRESRDESIYKHGWGIWAGLLSETNQKIDGDHKNLRVYETWMTPREMIEVIKSGKSVNKPLSRSNRANLSIPHQHLHFGDDTLKKSNKLSSKLDASKSTLGLGKVNINIHESVAYSPDASKFAIDSRIFMATTLYDLANKDGYSEIPFFPNSSITIKPVFKVLPISSGETKFEIAAWSGTTDELEAYPEGQWGTYVTVDTDSTSVSNGKLRSINEFVHYKLNREDVDYFKSEWTENDGNPLEVEPGDYVILVGMHVGTREITNWTWQTFWWDANADNPPLPSSRTIADMRPDILKGAARNYAMAVSYYMVNPNENQMDQPITGKPNYAFNPYLEAGFGPDVFDENRSMLYTKTDTIKTYVGVRTNCMSCHRMASTSPQLYKEGTLSITPYVGDSFVSKRDTVFNEQLLLDFAWSIQGNIDTTGIAAHINKTKKD
ncbi:MAG: hypothetical protein WBG46_04130 [Nonlabens sp.]